MPLFPSLYRWIVKYAIHPTYIIAAGMPVKKGSLACRNSTTVTQLINPKMVAAAIGTFHNARPRPLPNGG